MFRQYGLKALMLVGAVWLTPALVYHSFSNVTVNATPNQEVSQVLSNDEGTCTDANDDGYCDGTKPPQRCSYNVNTGKCHRLPDAP